MNKIQPKKQVYIIHGYESTPYKNWFPWLKETLLSEGISTEIFSMPDPNSPSIADWIAHLSKNIIDPDENTYLVAHSLGTITTLQYLQKANLLKPIGGFILVSGFDQPISDYPSLDPFTAQALDYQHIIESSEYRAIISAENDSLVPFSYSKELAAHIQADFYPFETGGHFMDSEGFTTFPFLYEVLKRVIDQPAHSIF